MQYGGDHDAALNGGRAHMDAPLHRGPVTIGDEGQRSQPNFAHRHPPVNANLTTTDGRGTYSIMQPSSSHVTMVDRCDDSPELPQTSAAVVYYNTCRGSQLYRPVEPTIHGPGLSLGGPSVTVATRLAGLHLLSTISCML